jgi:hypothetical protein
MLRRAVKPRIAGVDRGTPGFLIFRTSLKIAPEPSGVRAEDQ